MTQTGEKHDDLQLGKSPTTSPSACDVGDGVGLAIGGRVVAPGDASRFDGRRSPDHGRLLPQHRKRARTKFIVPSIAEAQGTGTERRHSFSDLLALRVARELREAGVSTQKLRRVVESSGRGKASPIHWRSAA